MHSGPISIIPEPIYLSPGGKKYKLGVCVTSKYSLAQNGIPNDRISICFDDA